MRLYKTGLEVLATRRALTPAIAAALVLFAPMTPGHANAVAPPTQSAASSDTLSATDRQAIVRAASLWASGDRDGGLAELDRLVSAQPASALTIARVHVLRSEWLRALGRPDDAAAAFEAALDSGGLSADQEARALVRLTQVHLSRGDLASAEAAAHRALTTGAADWSVWEARILAASLFNVALYEDSLPFAQYAVAGQAEPIPADLNRLARTRGMLEPGAGDARRALRRAALLSAEGDLQGAIAVLERASAELHPTPHARVTLHETRGLLLSRLDRHAEMIEAIDAALSAELLHAERAGWLLVQTGYALLELDQVEPALIRFEAGLSNGVSANRGLARTLTRLYADADRWADALPFAESLVDAREGPLYGMAPSEDDLRMLLRCYEALGREADAATVRARLRGGSGSEG